MYISLDKFLGYICFFFAIGFTVYAQLIIKWQVNKAGAMPADMSGKIWYLVHLIANPWVLSALVAAVLLVLAWVMVLARFELSYAYILYIGLVLVLVSGLSVIFLHEPLTLPKIFCFLLIMVGLIVLNL